MQEVVRGEVLKLLQAGIIYPISDSLWVSPTQVVPKKSGVTVVQNEKGRKSLHFLPQDGGRMLFGLCNAPATFQRCMLSIFSDMVERIMEVFMDDITVYGDSYEECLLHLEVVLQRCVCMSPHQKPREGFVSRVAGRRQPVQCVWFLWFVKLMSFWTQEDDEFEKLKDGYKNVCLMRENVWSLWRKENFTECCVSLGFSNANLIAALTLKGDAQNGAAIQAAILSSEGNGKARDSLSICFGHLKELSAIPVDPLAISGSPRSTHHNTSHW
ncbi:hypothetical protein CK203_095766 [Vitis vinifera]|uniref:Reverse transcriptase domain-containing protein n=1 Tax=Vitis vinifera TaxID=29760 RepID=A0A438BQV9_VITVI|nr:hypothetical protein CK203_095766 [Vitis vinifera]